MQFTCSGSKFPVYVTRNAQTHKEPEPESVPESELKVDEQQETREFFIGKLARRQLTLRGRDKPEGAGELAEILQLNEIERRLAQRKKDLARKRRMARRRRVSETRRPAYALAR